MPCVKDYDLKIRKLKTKTTVWNIQTILRKMFNLLQCDNYYRSNAAVSSVVKNSSLQSAGSYILFVCAQEHIIVVVRDRHILITLYLNYSLTIPNSILYF